MIAASLESFPATGDDAQPDAEIVANANVNGGLLRFSWDDLPAASANFAGTGGTLRANMDDFIVEEIASYLPSGSGAHAYARIEKRGLTTMDVLSALAANGVPRGTAGFAGQKDKYAVARQWISVPSEHAAVFAILDDVDGLTVLETSLHRNKLGVGHLRGNRFTVRVRNPCDDWRDIAEPTLEHLRQVGVPNYFGPQRFGTFNTNIADGLRLIKGERIRVDRRMRRFYQSALQSHLFNLLLKRRIESGLFDAVVLGDRAQRHDSGGMFVVDDPTIESERAKRLEISAALPLFGRKVRISEGAAGEMELQLLAQFALEYDQFRRVPGARRISRIRLDDATLSPADDGYIVEFTLPKGAYATSVMREVMKSA
ncbi:MAG: tRNA pseudouridine(13) synthase TruD [Chloroflexi bacterium]|nr:tRNA pseudouridine(13) synthase TruD [Chloroflexota bacterium]